MDNVKQSLIANKNDIVRKLGFGVVMTKAAGALEDLNGLMQKIRDYNNFTKDNDPYNEHDFGQFIWKGESLFWKIDYYNETLSAGEDPLSDKCKRVITVMLAEEY